MAREILSLEQLMSAPLIPDNDSFREHEDLRVYHRVRRAVQTIRQRLFNEILSEERFPTRNYQDWLSYLGLFEGIWLRQYSDISRKYPHLRSSIQPGNEQDNFLDDPIDLDEMRKDVSALNYGKSMGMKF